MGKRFVTYRTEDQQAGLVNVDENGVLKTGADEGGSGGGAFFVRIDMDENDNYIADKTYDEICEAIRNGLVPYCIYYDYLVSYCIRGIYLLPLVRTNSGALDGVATYVTLPAHEFATAYYEYYNSEINIHHIYIDINSRNSITIREATQTVAVES